MLEYGKIYDNNDTNDSDTIRYDNIIALYKKIYTMPYLLRLFCMILCLAEMFGMRVFAIVFVFFFDFFDCTQ